MVALGRLMLTISVVAALGVAGGHPSANGPDTQLWVQHYHGPGKGNDGASALAVSPGGRRIFVTGTSWTVEKGLGYGTVAYNASTGRQVWSSSYNGKAGSENFASGIVISRDGHRVFVTGDTATVAYNADNGAQLWVRRMNAGAIAISPDGDTVFVLGASNTSMPTVALDAATGQQLWTQSYAGPGGCGISESIAMDPSGSTVFVTGICPSVNIRGDYGTVAYDAATGRQLWANRYNGPGNSYDYPAALAVSPDGGTVYVTGLSQDASSFYSYATVAYNATTGDQLWVSRYHAAHSTYNAATSIVVSPSGGTIFVTGASSSSRDGVATIAYDAVTGARLWIRFYSGVVRSSTEGTQGLAATAKTLYVEGITTFRRTNHFLLIAYNATTGVERWLRHYSPAGRAGARAIGVSPTTGAVFIAGSSAFNRTESGYTAVSYQG